MAANPWTRAEDQVLEEGLATFAGFLPDRLQRIAEILQRPFWDVYVHYSTLALDAPEIASGRVNTPGYDDVRSEIPVSQVSETAEPAKAHGAGRKRRESKVWSAYEHKLFLIGLQRYGRGDWRSISRNVVMTKTPLQIASHAQKYFIRQELPPERKRRSIHDDNTVDMDLVAKLFPQWLDAFQPQPQPQVLQPLPLLSMNQQFMLVQGHAQLPPRDYQSLGQFPGDLDFRL
ncbi:PREDICTED: transcription factor DIVARICATA-like isoform X3 [Tarenaya hassleriana]|uniref:transcription factor DIVARICATA-like isoform X3 n=1 Tax=Tarenaya hassleriana TaxID=28532 RepID=UPI00053C1AE0|nr:PREDICTED: transcription factor DIVARICATA-like isoform X3 [Tarenaya hassleriana]XP_010543618.1 PREDICTED: transcription factor DIVARICATA-like isoform X3 [Tarenaya hassleriana]